MAAEFTEGSLKTELSPILAAIQSQLLDAGSSIATPQETASEAKLQRSQFDRSGSAVSRLEAWIDHLDAQLPPLTAFILPVKLFFLSFFLSSTLSSLFSFFLQLLSSLFLFSCNFFLFFSFQSGGRASAHFHQCRTVSPFSSVFSFFPFSLNISLLPAQVCRRAERSVVVLLQRNAVEPEVAVFLNRLSDFFFVVARYAAMRAGRQEVLYQAAAGRDALQRVPIARPLSGSRNLLNDRVEIGLVALGCVLLGYLVSRHLSQ